MFPTGDFFCSDVWSIEIKFVVLSEIKEEMKKFTIKEQRELRKEGKKGCQSCGEVFSLDNFYSAGSKNVYQSKCKECSKEVSNKRRIEHPEKVKASWKKWGEKNSEKRKKYMDKYRKENAEKRAVYRREYYLNNKDTEVQNSMDYIQNRLETDELFRIKEKIRGVIKSRIHGGKKFRTCKILGCDYAVFKKYIEEQFQPGMTWDNHAVHGWHFDHIVPISSAKTEEDMYRLNHYTNFQPLWAEENLKKSNKMFW